MAQQQSGGLLQQSYMVKPKAGMVQEFEKAYAKHLAWHREQNDSWIWETQQIVSGGYTPFNSDLKNSGPDHPSLRDPLFALNG